MGGRRAPPPPRSISPLSLPLLFSFCFSKGGNLMASPLPRRASSWSISLASRSDVFGCLRSRSEHRCSLPPSQRQRRSGFGEMNRGQLGRTGRGQTSSEMSSSRYSLQLLYSLACDEFGFSGAAVGGVVFTRNIPEHLV